MHKHLSSAARAKDTSYFMTDKEYKAAQARLAKRDAALRSRNPLRPTRYGLFIIGIFVGALLGMLLIYVIRTSGPIAGIMLAFGITMIFGVIGSHLGADK
jgi:hypothetical protein